MSSLSLDVRSARSAALSGKLLVHVAFHFVPDRVSILRQVLENFGSYELSEVDVVVDTNAREAAEVVARWSEGDDPAIAAPVRCSSRVHRDLAHPHVLTWMHRRSMAEQLEHHDFFMYLEDDILVPWQSIVAWHRDTTVLYPQGLLRGFLRVERNQRGVLVSTDLKRARRPVVRFVAGRSFFFPDNPYHAFWIYTREQMREFIRSDSWVDPPCKWDLRAKAAAGMMWSNLEGPGGGGGGGRPRRPSRTLIPLDASWRPAEEALVQHLGNGYAHANDGRRNAFGTIPIDRVVRRPLWTPRLRRPCDRPRGQPPVA